MYGIAAQLPEIRSARCTVFTVARGEHTGEFTDWRSRVTGLTEREAENCVDVATLGLVTRYLTRDQCPARGIWDQGSHQ